MLSNASHHTNRASSIPAPEEILSTQPYRAKPKAPSSDNFPDLDEERSEDNKQASKAEKASGTSQDEQSEFKHLMGRRDFAEMFNEFFVTGHKKLFLLQSKLLKERNINTTTLVVPSSINIHKMEALRRHLYRLQTVLFSTPKGKKYDMFQ